MLSLFLRKIHKIELSLEHTLESNGAITSFNDGYTLVSEQTIEARVTSNQVTQLKKLLRERTLSLE